MGPFNSRSGLEREGSRRWPINREQEGLDVAQCASAGVDDLVPVKRSFVDAARSSSSRLTGSRAAGPAVPPRQAGTEGEEDDPLQRECHPATSNPLPMHSTPMHFTGLHCTEINSTILHCNE